jgi:hypothetical protein
MSISREFECSYSYLMSKLKKTLILVHSDMLKWTYPPNTSSNKQQLKQEMFHDTKMNSQFTLNGAFTLDVKSLLNENLGGI